MNPRQLELLCHVVDGGSLTEAARRAGVSQPAVSQAMAALARQVGEPLLVRVGRMLQPTERALALARAARSQQAAWQQVQAAAGHPAAPRPGAVVRAGLAPAAGLLYGSAIVQAVRAAAPKAFSTIITGPAPEMLEQLARGELDLVIAPRPRGLRRAGLHYHVMYVSHPMVYCRTGHPLATATTLRAIARAQWAVAGSTGTPSNVVEEAFRVRGWRAPRIAVQCADYSMLLRIVGETDLLCVVSHPSLVTDAQRQGVTPLHIAEGLPHYEVCLFWYDADVRPWPPGMAQVMAALCHTDTP